MKYSVPTIFFERKIFLRTLFIALLIGLQAIVAFADESKDVQIFEVRKKLQMNAQDPIIRDYYVNAGQAMGLKEGAFITVFRKAPLADPYKQDTQSHVELPVGILRVIYSDRTMAIGRVQSLRSPKDSPVLDGEAFMVGDRLDLRSIGFDKKANSDGSGDGKQAHLKHAKPPTEDSETREQPEAKHDIKMDAKRAQASIDPDKGPRPTEIKPMAPQSAPVEVITK